MGDRALFLSKRERGNEVQLGRANRALYQCWASSFNDNTLAKRYDSGSPIFRCETKSVNLENVSFKVEIKIFKIWLKSA